MPFGFAFQAVTRSSIVLYGESFGTTIAPASSISLAIGVVWVSVAFDFEVYDGTDHAEPHLHGELAVALLVHGALQADRAAGAGQVEDLDAGRDLGVLHHLGGGPGGGVVPAARACSAPSSAGR